MEFDVWFARDNRGRLWFSLSEPGTGPDTSPAQCKSVSHAYTLVRRAGHKIAQVGITDIEML